MKRPSAGFLSVLDDLRDRYREGFLTTDPVRYPHRYADACDREVVAFLAAGLAFGRVASIFNVLDRLLERLGAQPRQAVEDLAEGRGPDLSGLLHRWMDADAIASVCIALGRATRRFGSLEALFRESDRTSRGSYRSSLETFSATLRGLAPRDDRSSRFFFAAPRGATAGKRLNLFLRWVARPADGIDLGLWSEPGTDRLLMPVDTHVAFLGHALGLSESPKATCASAEQITAAFRRVDARDPVKYDWALSRIGILGNCRHRRSLRHCAPCPLLAHCRL